MREDTRSHEAYEQALRVIPGGVNSPVRAAKAVGRDPLFIARGKGSSLWDIDGNQLIDYVCSWGPLILGHAPQEVVRALTIAAEQGLGFGAPTLAETQLAEELIAAYPSMDRVRLVTSGTEATMSALRLARAATHRDLIMKFEGGYHGHADALLVKAGSGALTTGAPTSAGVPEQTAQTTLVARYNDSEQLKALFAQYGEQIAAVIVEPVAGNMGVVVPRDNFLHELRQVTSAHGSLLIFDEVMTGFRVAYGGAQELYGIQPDLTCLGKIIGGGLPLAAYGGKEEYLQLVSPVGPVYQAGTLAGNPLAVAAGLATIELLKQKDCYAILGDTTERLVRGISERAAEYGVPVQVNSQVGMLSVFFSEHEVADYEGACKASSEHFASFYRAMLDEGIYLPPSGYEAWFPSLAHSARDIEKTLEAVGRCLQRMEHKERAR